MLEYKITNATLDQGLAQAHLNAKSPQELRVLVAKRLEELSKEGWTFCGGIELGYFFSRPINSKD